MRPGVRPRWDRDGPFGRMPAGRRLAVVLSIATALVLAALLLWVLASPERRQSPPQASSVRVRETKLGRILVDGHNRTLYLYTPDSHGRSHCYGKCAVVWPPALARGRPRAGSDVVASKLATVRRRDSSRQLVYNGHPLYRLVADERPGDLNGQAWGGVWFVVSPDGRQIGKAGKADDY